MVGRLLTLSVETRAGVTGPNMIIDHVRLLASRRPACWEREKLTIRVNLNSSR